MITASYRCADVGLARAPAHTYPGVGWPIPGSGGRFDGQPALEWLRALWTLDQLVEAVECASPVLVRQVTQLCTESHPDPARLHRAVRAVVRYLLRATGRATPFGLFAGVGAVEFGRHDAGDAVEWGADHVPVARAASPWLAEVVSRLESHPDLQPRLLVVVNNQAFIRGDRLVLPHPSTAGSGPPAAEVSVSFTAAVRLIVQEAAAPVRCADLSAKVAAEFPGTPPARVNGLLAQLVTHRLLLSSLHAASGVSDALSHLLAELDRAGADDLRDLRETVDALRQIAALITAHNSAGPADRRRLRRTARQRAADIGTTAEPVVVDLRLDSRIGLPWFVAREVENAASLLARLSAQPAGTTPWQQFHNRFFERYGVGALVPLREVVDPDIGLGFPTGFVDGAVDQPAPTRARDHRLLALAQAAALDRAREVVLDDRTVDELAGTTPRALPPHLELCVEVRADDDDALRGGRFEVVVLGVSRGAGTMTGRFLDVLDCADRSRIAAVLAQLPVIDDDAIAAQLTCTPLRLEDLHVTRAPQVLQTTISVGEHAGPDPGRIYLDDLAVSCDAHRLRLVSISRGRPVELVLLNAVDLRRRSSPLARFLAEIGRAHTAVVTGFDWGIAARLPYLPRLRHGRVVISPARWRLDGRSAAGQPWSETVAHLRMARGLPRRVWLADGDRRLPLDLDEPAHLALLRDQVARTGNVVLTETAGSCGYSQVHGWFGGRRHEVVAIMTAASPAPPQQVTAGSCIGTSVLVPGRTHGRLPGSSRWLFAKLYGSAQRQNDVLTLYLPRLLARWATPPRWWFIRYRDPADHLRLRIALPDPAEFGKAAHRVGAWADELRQLGLLGDLQLATSYPEVGRWGEDRVLNAAEDVFAADSAALLCQLAVRTQGQHPSVAQRAIRVAGLIDIACAFTGSSDAGMAWLIDHARFPDATPLPRDVLAAVVRLTDPQDDRAALRSSAGIGVERAWRRRRQALTRYRALVATSHLVPDHVLDGLLHAHHIRAVGIDRADERVGLRLARAAAQTWAHRREPREAGPR